MVGYLLFNYISMCFREEPFEPLDEEDYDDPTVQMELCDNSVDNSGNAV